MIILLFNTILGGLALLLAWPLLLLFFEVCSACFLAKRATKQSEETLSICVLIPAHDEAIGVAATVASIRANLRESDRILVVADNCKDNTAAVARDAGAEVIERTDLILRGKGYALAFGVERLKMSPPHVVIIIDADCFVVSGSLVQLAAAAAEKQRPMQANNKMQWPKAHPTSVSQRIAAFAWVFKNYVRALGLANLGLPCQLMGTGMALPWNLVTQLELGTSEIVEDIKMGLNFCVAGGSPAFYPNTEILSYFPTEVSAERSQRTRWEHGHMFLAFKYLPQVIFRSLLEKRMQLFFMASDLAILPLAFLAVAVVASTLLGLVVSYSASASWPAYLAFFNLGVFTFAVILGWAYFGRNSLSGRDLLLVPLYVFSKLPMYFGLLYKRQTQWVRTKRDEN